MEKREAVITAEQRRRHRVFRAVGVSVPRTLTLPTIRREVAVDNADGTDALTVARGAGSVVVPGGAALTIYTDGTANGIRPIGGAGGGGGAANFRDLDDTPSSYAGQSLKPVRVNLGETGLEFFTPGLSAGNWAIPFRGALIRRTGDATSLSFPWIAVWQAAVYDTDAFWSAGAPTRLTVPVGVTRVRLDERVPGTGLDLAIAADLASLHGGSLDLEAAEAEGLRATLRLPIHGLRVGSATPAHGIR